MARLGSIFDDEAPRTGERGPDLRCAVDVYRADLEAGRVSRVRVPLQLPHGEALVARAPSTLDRGEELQLHLPADTRDGTTVRLRGRGGVGAGGCGDLYLEVTVREGEAPQPSSRMPWLVAVLAALGAGIGLLAGALWGG